MSEREVSRIAHDLKNGNAEDAVNVIRNELQTHPQLALQELRQANQMAGPDARLHVGHKQDGDMALVDSTGRPIAHIGNPQQLQQQYGRTDYPNSTYPNNTNPNSIGRYADSAPYLNGQNRPQDQSYLNGQNNPNSRFQEQPYQNGRYQDGINGNQNYLNGRIQESYGQNQYGNPQAQIGRIAQDLVRGDARDAARELHNAIQHTDNPRRLIDEANRCADEQARRMGYRSAVEHIGTNRRGDIAVVDQNRQPIERVGNINDNYNNVNNGIDSRYQSYPNPSYPGTQNYYQDRQQSSYYPNQNPNYANPNYVGSNYGDNYVQPQQQYIPQQQYYPNNGGSTALGLGIGVVSGLLLSNIGRNNNYNSYHGWHRR
jgi:hypothetical protein